MVEQSRQEHHKMELVYSHPNGEDETYCPICGRRILIQWPPDYRKTVLEVGDEDAIHSGGKGSLEISDPNLEQRLELSAQDAAFSWYISHLSWAMRCNLFSLMKDKLSVIIDKNVREVSPSRGFRLIW